MGVVPLGASRLNRKPAMRRLADAEAVLGQSWPLHHLTEGNRAKTLSESLAAT